jgi:hypothetical protein
MLSRNSGIRLRGGAGRMQVYGVQLIRLMCEMAHTAAK